MFWRMTALSASSPVETILDKENFTLEELLDEEEIIQECKALNNRLINFLRDRAQVEQLLRYIVEEAPEDAENQRVFKFPFIACEIFTCEIDVILKTLVEEDELMDLLFSFLQPNRTHSTLLAGYFNKVVVCLMLRKTNILMNYIQTHQDVLNQLVDLIGITSIMEVLVRLVGADDHLYTNFGDVMQWLADCSLLEMIVDKLNPSNPPEVHANAAETLCAIARNIPSALASKLRSSSFVERIFGHALEDSQSKSALVHSLSVCITLLDPRRSTSYSLMHSLRHQHSYEPATVSHETVSSMLPKLGDLLKLLNVSSDEKVLATTYGELRPPLGKHRLKIVEFIAILLNTRNEVAEKELVSSGTIQNILDLFFEYPFNTALHHHVESIIVSCLESKNSAVIDHLLRDCNLVGKLVETDKHQVLQSDSNQPTLSTAGRQAPRAGNLGHITRISNKLVQLGNGNSKIQAYLQENGEWLDWENSVLKARNSVEDVYSWVCGRPTALQDRTRDSDEDEFQDRDYDVAALANNLSQAFRYSMYENDDSEEVHGSLERDDEDVYFDDESAEVVISSLRLGDDQDSSLFTNSNWFAFQDGQTAEEPLSSLSERMDEINLNGTSAGSSSSDDDDEVVVGGKVELADSLSSVNEIPETSTSSSGNFTSNNVVNDGDLEPPDEKATASGDMGDQFSDRPLHESVGLQDSSESQVIGSVLNPFNENEKHGGSGTEDDVESTSNSITESDGTASLKDSKDELAFNSITKSGTTTLPNDSNDGSVGTETSPTAAVPSLVEQDVGFVGVESEGTEKAMEHALQEGTVGEAGALKESLISERPEKEKSEEDGAGAMEFNDTNYWRVDQEVAVGQQ